MNQKYKIQVSYGIEEFEFDPDKITSITGIKPDKILREGKPVSWQADIKPGRVIPKIKFNLWEIESKIDPLADVEEHMRALIQRLKPSWHEFIKLGSQYGGIFACVIWDYSDARPPVFFDQKIIQDVAELNALIHVSFYPLSNNNI